MELAEVNVKKEFTKTVIDFEDNNWPIHR